MRIGRILGPVDALAAPSARATLCPARTVPEMPQHQGMKANLSAGPPRPGRAFRAFTAGADGRLSRARASRALPDNQTDAANLVTTDRASGSPEDNACPRKALLRSASPPARTG